MQINIFFRLELAKTTVVLQDDKQKKTNKKLG